MAPGKSIIFIEQNSQVQVELGTESNLIGIFFWKQVNVRTDVHFRGNFTRARKCNLIGPRQGMPHSTAQALSLEFLSQNQNGSKSYFIISSGFYFSSHFCQQGR